MGRKRKLTLEQVKEIKILLERGITHVRVAKDYGVSIKTLWTYLNEDMKVLN